MSQATRLQPRLRGRLYTLAAAYALAVVPLTSLSPGRPAAFTAAAACCALLLAVRWLVTSRRGAPTLAGDVAEVVALAGFGLSLGHPEAVLPLLGLALLARALRDRRRPTWLSALLLAVTYIAALLGEALRQAAPALEVMALLPVPVLAVLGAVAQQLMAHVVSLDHSRDRERLLARSAAALLAAPDRDAVYSAALSEALSLIQDVPGARAGICEGDRHAARVVSSLGHDAGSPLGSDAGAVIAELGRARVLVAPFVDDSGGTPGALLLAADSQLPDDVREGMEALAAQLQLALQRVRQAETRVASEARMRALVEHGTGGITLTDENGSITYATPPLQRIIGFEPDDLLGTPFAELAHPRDRDAVEGLLSAARQSHEPHRIECRLRRRDGGWADTETIARNLLDVEHIGAVVLHSRDLSERNHLQARLDHVSSHDGVTELPNRAYVLRRLSDALARMETRPGQVSVLTVALPTVGDARDRFGHLAAEELLRRAAERLRRCVRPGDVLGHAEATTFVLLLESEGGAGEAWAVADRITAALREPVAVGDHMVRLHVDGGVAATSDAFVDPDGLLRDAEIASRMRRQGPSGGFRRFEPSMRTAVLERAELEDDLAAALAAGDLRLAYQPIVDLRSGDVRAVEALARWEHPTRGTISPAVFVAVAESSGLIGELGEWVLAEACGRAARWQEISPICLNVNLSGLQLVDPTLPDTVLGVLGDTGLAAGQLTLEITESVLMDDVPLATRQLRLLKDLGVRLAIDDFGTGYSSLSYLREFCVDMLKIDRSFIADLAAGVEGRSLATAILRIAHSLGMTAVAEGVEQPAQRDILRALSCPYAQGYLFGRPVGADEITALLEVAALHAGMQTAV